MYKVLLAISVSIPCVPHTYANLFPELEACLATSWLFLDLRFVFLIQELIEPESSSCYPYGPSWNIKNGSMGVSEGTFTVYGYKDTHVTVLARARDVLPGRYTVP